MHRHLGSTGPLETLDRALFLVRRAEPSMRGRAWLGGSLVAAVCIGIYYLERVEGVFGLRPLFAVALVLAFWGRALLLAGAARQAVCAIWAGVDIPKDAGRALDVVRLASIVGLGLWVWSWLLVAASLLGPEAVFLVVPLFAVRGAIAPSWIARAGCTEDGGVRGFVHAVTDSSGHRLRNVVVELFVLIGALGLFVALYALTLVGINLCRSLLGLDVALLEAFLSPKDTFVLLVVGSLTLVVLEPLRAALSASVFVDARVHDEGLDLEAAVDEAIAAPRRRTPSMGGSGRAVGTAVALLLSCALGLGLARPVHAQEPSDLAVRAQVRGILARHEFREFGDSRGKSLRQLIEHLLELLRPRPKEPTESHLGTAGLHIPMPPPIVFILLGVLLLGGVATYLVLTRRRDREAADEVDASAGDAVADPRDRPPRAHLDDAAVLAEQGRFREALRALYLATLVALDRRRLIAFDPALTNWQYMRQMPDGDARSLFGHFTGLFDHKWYGDEATTLLDYEEGRNMADRICAPPGDG